MSFPRRYRPHVRPPPPKFWPFLSAISFSKTSVLSAALAAPSHCPRRYACVSKGRIRGLHRTPMMGSSATNASNSSWLARVRVPVSARNHQTHLQASVFVGADWAGGYREARSSKSKYATPRFLSPLDRHRLEPTHRVRQFHQTSQAPRVLIGAPWHLLSSSGAKASRANSKRSTARKASARQSASLGLRDTSTDAPS